MVLQSLVLALLPLGGMEGLPEATARACLPHVLEAAGWAVALMVDAIAAGMGRRPSTEPPVCRWSLLQASVSLWKGSFEGCSVRPGPVTLTQPLWACLEHVAGTVRKAAVLAYCFSVRVGPLLPSQTDGEAGLAGRHFIGFGKSAIQSH